MRTNLFLIPNHLGGVPLFGFGLLLGVLLLATAAWVAWVIRRPEGKQEVAAMLPMVGIVAVVILLLPRFLPDGFPVRGYGTLLIIAAVSGIALATRRARQAGVHPDTIMSLAFWMFISGIAGGRVFYVIEYWQSNYAQLPLFKALKEVVMFANGGLVVYGALIGASLAFVLFVRRQRLPMLAMADLIAPSLVVGLAFGRIGCLLNGCCFGGVCELPWAITFPKEHQSTYSPPYTAQLIRGEFYGFRLADRNGQLVIASVASNSAAEKEGIEPGDQVKQLDNRHVGTLGEAGRVLEEVLLGARSLQLQMADGSEHRLPAQGLPARSLPVHPTQLYSAINAGLLAFFLWCYYPARRRDGEVFALLMTFYPIARFLLEGIRIDETSFLGTGLSISQNMSLLLLGLVALLWVYLLRQPAGRFFDAPEENPPPA